MKTLKQIILCIILISCANTLSYAQSTPKLSEAELEEFKQEMAVFFERLALSPAQETQFEALSMKYAELLVEIKESDRGRLGKYKELQKLRTAKNIEMESMLSKEQYDLYLERQAENREKLKARSKEF